LVNLDIKQGN